jgi:hypothetical protein
MKTYVSKQRKGAREATMNIYVRTLRRVGVLVLVARIVVQYYYTYVLLQFEYKRER